MTRKTLWISLFVLGISSALFGVYFLVWLSHVSPAAQSACGCEQKFFTSHPFLISFLGLLLAVPFLGLLRGIVRTVFVNLKTYRLEKRARTQSILSLEDNVWLFEDAAPHAFTIGLFRPKTFVSTGAWQVLRKDEEREALLLHEATHRKHHDPIIRFGIILLSAVIGWVPGVRRALKVEELFMELRADAAAEEKVGKNVLRSVFQTLSGSRMSQVAVASFVDVEERLHQNLHSVAFSRMRTRSIVLAIFSIATVGLVFTSLSAIAAEQTGGHCVAIAPVCVTNLPKQSPMPHPVSTPSSLPGVVR